MPQTQGPYRSLPPWPPLTQYKNRQGGFGFQVPPPGHSPPRLNNILKQFASSWLTQTPAFRLLLTLIILLHFLSFYKFLTPQTLILSPLSAHQATTYLKVAKLGIHPKTKESFRFYIGKPDTLLSANTAKIDWAHALPLNRIYLPNCISNRVNT